MKPKFGLKAITFRYSGIAESELDAAREIGKDAGVTEHRFFGLPDLRESGDIKGADFERMPSTYIPLRNTVFYACAASFAEEVRADVIVGGHNRDDWMVFADATPGFFGQFQKSIWEGSKILRRKRTRIELPLANKTKIAVVRLAARLGVPLEKTWSCHRDGAVHCWNCDGCTGRRNAFRLAGVVDPLRETDVQLKSR